ncbi:hypothetical protein [Candidatus Poriferisodalis sp.]|uniref:hypothetical protein n=1 Tax=Candidatus Poriferisodalis sp. TaxID=3101277 RepID=UPI003B02E738
MKFIIAALLVAGIGLAPQPASAAAAFALGASNRSVAFQTGSVGTATSGMLSALSLPPPVPFFAPPAQRVRTLVGVDTWFWVTAASWRPVVRVVLVGKVVVTLVATPVTLQFVPGDGSPPVSCPGPGTPWLWPGTRSLCSHTFQRTSMSRALGRFSGTVQTMWTIRWTSSTGLSGTAGPVAVPTPVSLRVVEAQAVLER